MKLKFWLLFTLMVFLTGARQSNAQIEGNQVAYLGGTLPIAEGAVGSFNFSSSAEMIFQIPGASSPAIPYKGILRVTYRREVTHHIGVLPAIAVGLLRKRKRQHFFDISYQDGQGVAQSMSFEVAKHQLPILYDVLRARAPQICEKDRCAALEAELKASQSGFGR